MKACGLIVEYNPLHNGHVYHIQEAKKITKSDCIIAVMSGSFLQRGEPAIIDKFNRTKMALHAGVDIVIELPYRYAVQSSELFAKGSIQILQNIGVSSICFGSESGNINDFLKGYQLLNDRKCEFESFLKHYIDKGYSYPYANQLAYNKVGLASTSSIDLSKPNNILGFSYIKTIYDHHLNIKPYTIKRIKSNFHETDITGSIASATSIRKQLLSSSELNNLVQNTLPKQSIDHLRQYKQHTNIWHTWEKYFRLLHYRVMTMALDELKSIEGVDEGLENRIKNTAKEATSFRHWMELIKTKRYTWTRLQRIFVHILTNTKKSDYTQIEETIPYIRLLGMSNRGRRFLNTHKKDIHIPIVTQLERNLHPMFAMEERVTNAYYSILPAPVYQSMRKQELSPPIFI